MKKQKKDKVVISESGIKYTISSSIQSHNYDPFFDKKLERSRKMVKKTGLPKEIVDKNN